MQLENFYTSLISYISHLPPSFSPSHTLHLSKHVSLSTIARSPRGTMADSTASKRKTPPADGPPEADYQRHSKLARTHADEQNRSIDLTHDAASQPPSVERSTRGSRTQVASTINLADRVLLRVDMLPDAIRNHTRLGKAAAWVAETANAVNDSFDDMEWETLALLFRQAYFHLDQSARASPTNHRLMKMTGTEVKDVLATRPSYFIMNSLYPCHPKLSKFNAQLRLLFRHRKVSTPPRRRMPEQLTLVNCNLWPSVSEDERAELELKDDPLPPFFTQTDVLWSMAPGQRGEGGGLADENQTDTVVVEQHDHHPTPATPRSIDSDTAIELNKKRQDAQVHTPQPQERFPSTLEATWQDVVKWSREKQLPVARALLRVGLDPRHFSYAHLADDQPYFEKDKDKWNTIFANLDKTSGCSSARISVHAEPAGDGRGPHLPSHQSTADQDQPTPTAGHHSETHAAREDILDIALERSGFLQPGVTPEQRRQPKAGSSTRSTSQSPLVKLVELFQAMGRGSGDQKLNDHGAWKRQLERLAVLQERSAADRVNISDDLARIHDQLTDLTKKKKEADVRNKAVNDLLRQIISTGEGAAVCALLGGSDLGEVQTELGALERQFGISGEEMS